MREDSQKGHSRTETQKASREFVGGNAGLHSTSESKDKTGNLIILG